VTGKPTITTVAPTSESLEIKQFTPSLMQSQTDSTDSLEFTNTAGAA
jgi:hypothetical protein